MKWTVDGTCVGLDYHASSQKTEVTYWLPRHLVVLPATEICICDMYHQGMAF